MAYQGPASLPFAALNLQALSPNSPQTLIRRCIIAEAEILSSPHDPGSTQTNDCRLCEGDDFLREGEYRNALESGSTRLSMPRPQKIDQDRRAIRPRTPAIQVWGTKSKSARWRRYGGGERKGWWYLRREDIAKFLVVHIVVSIPTHFSPLKRSIR